MDKEYDLIFEYKTGRKLSSPRVSTAGSVFYMILFLVFLCGFIYFMISAFKVNIKYIWIANLCGISAILFGPYSYLKNRYYYFALSEDGLLIMKTISGLFPKTYKININDISEIEYDDPVKSLNVVFKNSDGKTLGKFNHTAIGYNRFKKYIDVIAMKNQNIGIKI